MNRRSFFAGASQMLAASLITRTGNSDKWSEQQPSQASPGELEQRVATVLQAFDAQGNHRTGTAADKASAEWLADQVRQLGIEPSLEPFALSRVDPQLAYARIGNRRIDGVPMFDASFTTADGVRGRLGLLNSDADVGFAGTTAVNVAQTAEADIIPAARRSSHRAVILVTGGTRPGLFLSNAPAFLNPTGPPMLQVSSVEGAWLHEQAREHAEVTVVAAIERFQTQALNVTATISGSDRSLSPLVFMAPRSGWWQSVSEQGSRLVCWLEIMRVLAAAKPARDCHFVALSGHELGFMGMTPYLERRKELINHAKAWIFLGSDIGAPRQRNLIHASDDMLEQWLVAALAKHGVAVDAKEQHSAKARGETAVIQRGGARFITLACASSVFHNVGDRWPESVDVSLIARYAKALAEGANELAQRRPAGEPIAASRRE
ncbi:MAG TPA: hypothetical protein VFI95_09525 [Terriglobales bacterium]|nr:hypothetical protein [Terriglobales bacterium]